MEHTMSENNRKIEVFTAGCAVCKPQVDAILAAACDSCDITVHDLSTDDAALVGLASGYGVQRLPAVVIDGRLASCCKVGKPDLVALREAEVTK